MAFKLAELFVQFSQQGVEAVSRAIGNLKGDLDKVGAGAAAAATKATGSFGKLPGAMSAFARAGQVAAGTVSAALGKLHDGIAKIEEGAGKMGRIATVAFAGLTGTVGGFVRSGLAGSAEMEAFTAQMQRLSREVAGIFLPQFTAMIGLVQRAADYFHGLTGAQQANIARWVEAAAVGLAFAMIMPKVIAGLRMAAAGVKAMGAALSGSLAAATGGLLPLLGMLVTAFAGLFGAAAVAGGEMGELANAFKPVLDALKQIGASVVKAMQPMIRLVAVVIQGFAGSVQRVMPRISALIDHMAMLFAQAVEAIEPFLPSIIAGFDKLADAIMSVFEAAQPLIDDIWDELIDSIPFIIDGFNKMVDVLVEVVRWLANVVKHAKEGYHWLRAQAIEFATLGIVKAADVQKADAALDEFHQKRRAEFAKRFNRTPKAQEGGAHQAPTPARTGSEAITATISRLQQASLKQDWQKLTAEETKKSNGWLEKIHEKIAPQQPLFAH